MKTFLISDTHFGHGNILTFKRLTGEALRNFSSVEEMDEIMVQNWNNAVGQGDKVYHLGDVTFSNKKLVDVFNRLNGRKVLIKGNHDNLKLAQYQKYFYDIRAYHVLDKLVLAHVPIHPESLRRWRGQVHGHTHDTYLENPKYYNVCVETTNYAPVDFEEIREYFKTVSD